MKGTFSVVILMFICLVLVSSLTLAYFTDVSDGSEIHFTTGTVEVDIKETSSNDDWADWKPGEGNAKNITWTFANSGSIPARLRVRINTEWVPQDAGVEEPRVFWTQKGIPQWTQEDSDGYWEYPEVIDPGEEVQLSFEMYINSIKGYRGAEYKLMLDVEAVQASNNEAMEWN